MLNAFPTPDRHVRTQLHCSEMDIYTARSSVYSFKAGATQLPCSSLQGSFPLLSVLPQLTCLFINNAHFIELYPAVPEGTAFVLMFSTSPTRTVPSTEPSRTSGSWMAVMASRWGLITWSCGLRNASQRKKNMRSQMCTLKSISTHQKRPVCSPSLQWLSDKKLQLPELLFTPTSTAQRKDSQRLSLLGTARGITRKP